MRISSFLPKEILVVTIGILLIVGVIMLTLFSPKKNDRPLSNTFSEDSNVTNFFKQVSYIQKDDLQTELSQEDLIIFDLRDRSYYDVSHIPGSYSVTPETLISSFMKQKPNPQKVILVDISGQTPALEQSVQALRKENIQNIRILAGGYADWNELIYPTITWGDPESALDHSKIRALSIENAKLLFSEKEVLFLDVRSSEEYAKEHIEKSLHIPFGELEDSREMIPRTKMVVVYGATPIDSFRAGVRLFDLGYRLAYTVNGGYIDLK